MYDDVRKPSRRVRVIFIFALGGYFLGASATPPAQHPVSQFGVRLNSLPQALSAGALARREQAPVDPRAAELAARIREQLKHMRESAGTAKANLFAAGVPRPSALENTLSRTSASQASARTARKLPSSNAQDMLWNSASAVIQNDKPSSNASDRLRVLMSDAGTPRQIEAKDGGVMQRAFTTGTPQHIADELTAMTFLRANRALLGVMNPDREFKLYREQTGELGWRHLRFAQMYNGLPVWGSELIVHLNPQGDVNLVNGAFFPTPRKLITQPVVDSQGAIRSARTAVQGGDEATVTEQPMLVVYAAANRPSRLAWRLELKMSLTSDWLVMVDALNGKILTAYNQVMQLNAQGSGVDLFGESRPLNAWEEGGLLYLVDTSKAGFDPSSDPPSPDTTRGGIVILDASNQPPTSNPQTLPQLSQITSNSATGGWLPDGISAAFDFSETYDYYFERHHRTAIDGHGGTIKAVTRLGRGFSNAFWDPNQQTMFFGDALPYAGALDVVGHELTHGVTAHSAGLIGGNQPGALNEAFSDIFGEAIEAFAFGGPDWVTGAALGQPLRSLQAPGSIEFAPGRPYPSKMSEYVQLPNNDAGDFGGVHENSTIISHVFYLLAAGLPGAIGINDAERIFYRALTVHLVQRSQFIDARLACIQAARELFGATSIQAQRTAKAFDAGEIFGGAGTPAPTPVPSVGGVDATLFVFFDSASQQFFLGRRERALGDPAQGVMLGQFAVTPARPSVARNGRRAVYVNSVNDICFIATGGATPEQCEGLTGQIHSVALAPNGKLLGIVFRDPNGNPEPRITVMDISTPEVDAVTYPLIAAVLDGGALDTIVAADSMDFSLDGRFLYYDALNAIQQPDGTQLGVWSIYAIDRVSGATLPIVPPAPGLDIAFPALGQTSDNFITFDALNQATGTSQILAGNLSTGALAQVGIVNGDYGIPGYTGDDSAIVYSDEDAAAPTGLSLVRQPLAQNRLTPQGAVSPWLRDADFGVIYRRPRIAAPPSVTPGYSGGGWR